MGKKSQNISMDWRKELQKLVSGDYFFQLYRNFGIVFVVQIIINFLSLLSLL